MSYDEGWQLWWEIDKACSAVHPYQNPITNAIFNGYRHHNAEPFGLVSTWGKGPFTNDVSGEGEGEGVADF